MTSWTWSFCTENVRNRDSGFIQFARQASTRGNFMVSSKKLYHGRFRTYFRISAGQFELLLLELGPHLRQKNNFREPIEPKQHLSVSEVK